MLESTLKEAFVGSQRDESGIWRLLLQCGAELIADVAKYPTPPGVAPVDLSNDERAPLSDEEARTLLEIVKNDAENEVETFDGPFDYFLERVVASGKRVPSKFFFSFAKAFKDQSVSVDDLAQSGQRELDVVRRHSLLFGRLGRWALEISPSTEIRNLTPTLAPLEIFESSDEQETTRVWREGSDVERVVALDLLRKRDPARARELLREDWKTLKKTFLKAACLRRMFVGLSEDDVDFLQGLEKKTRDSFLLNILRDLLASLPTSEYAQKMRERAEAFLTNPESLLALETTREEKVDFMFEAPDGASPRSAFLTLGRVPLACWEEILSASPTEIRARLLDVKELPTFSQAQLRSFALFGASDEWFEVCCESFADVYRLSPRLKRLGHWNPPWEFHLQLRASERFTRVATQTGRVDYFKRLLAIWNEETATKSKMGTRLEFEYGILQAAFQRAPYPWSEELARVLCETLIELITSSERKFSAGSPKTLENGVSRSAKEKDDEVCRYKAALACAIAYSPRVVREEYRNIATQGAEVFTRDEAFVKAYADACAWRERFDRLFESQEQG